MATSKEFKNKVTPPNWSNIDGENNQEITVSTEELNKKVEEYEKKDLKQVSIKDTENLPVWKSVLYDEDGNESATLNWTIKLRASRLTAKSGYTA